MPEKKPASPGGDDRTVMLSARVPIALRKRVGRYAVDREVGAQDVVREALEEYLKKRGA